ncbi:MAG: pyruvate kinase [Mycoplasmataceae bacterium]|nr:pyruvate kinase [Mycoplasmataceae bacterium]
MDKHAPIRVKSYYKRTKIIATLGPAITQQLWTLDSLKDPKNAAMVALAYQRMEGIIKSGVTCVRLNFSHGAYEEQQVRINIARDVAKKLNRNISVMLDTKGPEIRLGKIKDGPVPVLKDSNITIYTKEMIIGDNTKFSVTDSTGTYNMSKDVKVDGTILVDDGKLQLKIKEVDIDKGIIKTTVLNNHSINDKKRINLPNTEYSMPFMSQKDRDDILFGIKNNVDYIAASFVNSKENVQEIREFLDANGGSQIQIISKIESTHAIRNIDEILNATNGVMVARGDLALEIPFYDVPYWQKYIIRKCRLIGKPSIVATQMLDSLERNIQPTRAEVTDVFFAVDRGADSTMLSGESAQGQFPVQAVYTMRQIDKTSELLFDYHRAINWYFRKTKLPRYSKLLALKIAHKCLPSHSEVAPNFKYNFVVIFTNDKQTIWTISNIRPAATIIVVTDERELLTCFGINYAIQTHYVKDLNVAKNKDNYHQVAREAIDRFEPGEQQAIVFLNRKFKEI